jgi:hypothetical protein
MYELSDPFVPSVCPYCNIQNRELLDKFNAELYEMTFGGGKIGKN